MITVLALDIAMGRTGWALGGPSWPRPRWGVFETERWKDHEGENLSRFRRFLDNLREDAAITHVAIEQVFVDVRAAQRFQYNGTQGQMMLSAIALEFAHGIGARGLEVNIDDWRKRFLGVNRRPKDAGKDDKYWKNLALRACAARDWYCAWHDEAEALGILDFTLAALDRDYAHRTGPAMRRQQSAADEARRDAA